MIHLCSRNIDPDGGAEVDLLPGGLHDFRGTRGHQGGEPESLADDEGGEGEVRDAPHELADLGGVGDRRPVLHSWLRRHGATEIPAGIRGDDAEGDRIERKNLEQMPSTLRPVVGFPA